MTKIKKKTHINKVDILQYIILLNENSKNNNLISNYNEIEEILNSDKIDLFRFLYFNRSNVHQILYNEKKFIHININKNRNLADYFYLNLLINEEPSIINYVYSIDYIYDIINYQKNINDTYTLKKIILSKIIIEIIDNYKNSDNCNENEEICLEKIENENINFINNQIHNLKEFTICENYEKNIIVKKLDIIYINIIISLFNNNKFIDFEYTTEIFKQLELESIDLTENMIKKLLITFNLNNDYMKKYMINNINDLLDINKINFYYIIFKHIFNNNNYIYNFPFLYETRKKILRMINNNLEQSFVFNSSFDIRNKIEYIFKRITDSEYIFDKYFNASYKLKTVCDYYKNFLFESKKEYIDIIENIIKNEERCKIDYNKLLEDYDLAERMNQRFPVISFLLKKGSKSNIKSEKELNIYIKHWEQLEKLINSKNYENIKDEDKKLLYKYVNSSNNKNILNKIFNEDIYKWLLTILNKSNNKSTFLNLVTAEKTTEKEVNNNECINDIFHISESESLSSDRKMSNSYRYVWIESFSSQNANDINSLNDFIKIVGNENNKHIETSECMKEISNGYLISYGINTKIYLLENKGGEIVYIGPIKDSPKYVINIEHFSNKTKNKDFLIICTKDKLRMLDLQRNNTISNFNEENFNYLGKINDDSFFVCKEGKTIIYRNITEKISPPQRDEILSGQSFKEGIAINENLLAFTSNRVISGGEDRIIIYNIADKKREEFKRYSFIYNSNGLCVMEINNNKILLCACKKYLGGQKNGILLINDVESIFSDNYDKINNIKFKNIENFEVHCFCQISYLDDNDKNILEEYKPLFKQNYLLVGGFNKKKRKGCIKLCKINDEFEFEEITNIEKSRNFKGFKGAISCITQTNKGDIIISCWDGNNYIIKYKALKKYLNEIKANNYYIEGLFIR